MTYTVKGNTLFDTNFVGYFSNVTVTGGGFLKVGSGYQGSISGYTAGGFAQPPVAPTPTEYNTIDKFPFAADGNATDVGDLLNTDYQLAGHSSAVSGYTSGGSPASNLIQKFPFATNGNATDVGDLPDNRTLAAGHSSLVNGYTSGGTNPPSPIPGSRTIFKFSFTSDGNATENTGILTAFKTRSSGHSSSTHGYTAGGLSPAPGNLNIIDKFPFASDTNATDVGDLTAADNDLTGVSSEFFGYVLGPSPTIYSYQKFSFVTDGNATDVADVINTPAGRNYAGTNSTISGYAAGSAPNVVTNNIIQKFPFATDADTTDVGDLTQGRGGATGAQV